MRSNNSTWLALVSTVAAVCLASTSTSWLTCAAAAADEIGQSAGSARSLTDPFGKSSVALTNPMPTSAPLKPTLRLEGKAEVSHTLYTNYDEWQAAQTYKQGVVALQMSNFVFAAECFKKAADGFANSPYDGRFQAEARFAEGQSDRLMRQYAKAAKAYTMAIDLFKVYDPRNPYLRAAIDQLNLLPKEHKLKAQAEHKEITLKALPPIMDRVNRTISLSAKHTELSGGVDIAALKDEDFFNGGNLLAQAAAVDVHEGYVKDQVYKAFLDMNCLEFTDLGANYYTAGNSYKPFKSDGKTIVVGAADDSFAPSVRININGKPCNICMDLPGMSRASKNALLVSDGQHILAIDPRTKDTWKLVTTFTKKAPDFSWTKLEHVKHLWIPKGAQAHSLFGGHSTPATARTPKTR
ncbi:MAG TPA: hypothetical protein V6C72_15045 [Chroococcales cyanobacterium]